MSASGRIRALDLLRVVAAVQMVQGHTIDALLAPEYRHGGAYQAWLALRGLTSVAFLFAAGLSFQLATLQRLEQHLRDPAAIRARFMRAGMLIVLGYLLRLPLPLPADEHAFALALEHTFATDVLQCIGVSLALVEALALVLRSAPAVEAICALLGMALLALSPLAARLDPHGSWLPISTFFTPRAGSQFPLLPWAGHLLLGVALCRQLFAPRGRALRFSACALGLLGLSKLAAFSGVSLCADHLARLAWVVSALWLLSWLERFVAGERPALWRLSSETLFIYAFHVVVVYGRDLGLADSIGRRLSPLAAVAFALGMIGLSFGCALGYRRIWSGLARDATTG